MIKLKIYHIVYKITSNNLIISDSIFSKSVLLLNDIESTKRHIKADDYFGTLATILDLIRQTTTEKSKSVGHPMSDKSAIKQTEYMKELRDDLVFLQKNYKIVKKK